MAQKVNQVPRYVQHNHDNPEFFFKLRTGNLKGFCRRALLHLKTFFIRSDFSDGQMFFSSHCCAVITCRNV